LKSLLQGIYRATFMFTITISTLTCNLCQCLSLAYINTKILQGNLTKFQYIEIHVNQLEPTSYWIAIFIEKVCQLSTLRHFSCVSNLKWSRWIYGIRLIVSYKRFLELIFKLTTLLKNMITISVITTVMCMEYPATMTENTQTVKCVTFDSWRTVTRFSMMSSYEHSAFFC